MSGISISLKIINRIFILIKGFIFNIYKNYRHIAKLIFIFIPILRKFKLFYETKFLELKLNKIYGRINLNRLTYVKPQKVIYYLINKEFFHWKNSYRVLNGNWDLDPISFDNLLQFKSIKDRYLFEKNWEDTELYNLVPNEKSKKKYTWTFRNEFIRDQKLKEIHHLYRNIKKNGYKSQKDLFSFKKWCIKYDWKPVLDEILIAIGRDGDMFFINGKHRICIAKILNLTKIPVIILIRHKQWMEFRKRLFILAKNSYNGKIISHLRHPDLQDIPTIQREETFNNILTSIDAPYKKILVLGARLGYFCQKFEEEGFNCYAYESNRIYSYFLKKLKTIENLNFNILSESISDYSKSPNLDFDIILAINNFVENKDEFSELLNYLKQVRVRDFFLEIYNINKIYVKDNIKFHDLNDFIDFIIENTALNRCEYKIKTEMESTIIKFTSL